MSTAAWDAVPQRRYEPCAGSWLKINWYHSYALYSSIQRYQRAVLRYKQHLYKEIYALLIWVDDGQVLVWRKDKPET